MSSSHRHAAAVTAPSPFDAVMQVASRPPEIFVEGRGSWLKDANGKAYLDFVQGWAVNCLGHCAAPIVDAITRQAARLINCSPAFYNEPMIRLAELIACHSGLHQSFFATLYEPKVPGFPKVPLNDLSAVEAAIGADTVAVMLEPIQGEAGVFAATDAFLRGLRALTRQRGILLILDEIQTGLGRTGRFFGFQHAGIAPDIMTLGKGLGGGVPLAALVAHRDVCCFEPGDQGGTFNGNPLATAAGCAVMEELAKPGFLAAVAEAGDYLASRLTVLAHKHRCGGLRGKGLLLALDLEREIGANAVELARARGLLLNAPRSDTLRFMPALTVTRREIDRMIEILDGVLEDLVPAPARDLIS